MSLEERLRKRVEREVEESQNDLDFAAELISENPDSRSVAESIVFSSVPVLFLKAVLFVGGFYLAWKALSLQLFVGGLYILTGLGTAKFSEYSVDQWEYWFTTVFWLLAVLYGLLPDRVRVEK